MVSRLGVVFLSCLAIKAAFSQEYNQSTISTLRRILLKDYDKYARPVQHHSNTTIAVVNFVPRYLLDLNEETQIISINGWLILEWKDEHLKWTPEKYDGIRKITMADHEVWQPDIVVYESIPTNRIDPQQNTHVTVQSDGTITWVPPVTLYTLCPLDATNNLQDIQNCQVTFGSWNHDGSAVDLRTSSSHILRRLINRNTKWKIINANSSRIVTKYQCCNEPYITIVYAFSLQRKPIVAQAIVRIPTIIAMTVTLLIFWLPPESEQKIIVGCMILLLLTALLIYTAFSVQSSLAAGITVSLLHHSMAVVFSALVIETFVINLSKSSLSFGPPSFVNRILSGTVGRLLCVPPDIQSSESLREFYSLEDGNIEYKRFPSHESWRRVAVATDRVAFLMYIIVIAIVLNTN